MAADLSVKQKFQAQISVQILVGDIDASALHCFLTSRHAIVAAAAELRPPSSLL